jgi:hypothetical protein
MDLKNSHIVRPLALIINPKVEFKINDKGKKRLNLILLSFVTINAILPSATFHSQSILFPSFNFHRLTILIGIVMPKANDIL